MRKTASALGVLLLALVGCDTPGGLAFAPQACILASQDEVRQATGNRHLVRKGNVDTEIGGSVCTYRDTKHNKVAWRFADEPVVNDDMFADLKKQLKSDGYVTASVEESESPAGPADGTYTLSLAGEVRGIITRYPDVTIVIYAPAGARTAQMAALRDHVWDGFTDQAAAAVAGQ